MIPGAGQGAFAATRITKGSRVGEYSGQLLCQERYERLRNPAYVFEVRKKFEGRYYTFYIDAKDPRRSSELRYVNGARTPAQKRKINVEAYQYKEKIYYRATRTIRAGEELLIDYGDNYWH